MDFIEWADGRTKSWTVFVERLLETAHEMHRRFTQTHPVFLCEGQEPPLDGSVLFESLLSFHPTADHDDEAADHEEGQTGERSRGGEVGPAGISTLKADGARIRASRREEKKG